MVESTQSLQKRQDVIKRRHNTIKDVLWEQAIKENKKKRVYKNMSEEELKQQLQTQVNKDYETATQWMKVEDLKQLYGQDKKRANDILKTKLKSIQQFQDRNLKVDTRKKFESLIDVYQKQYINYHAQINLEANRRNDDILFLNTQINLTEPQQNKFTTVQYFLNYYQNDPDLKYVQNYVTDQMIEDVQTQEEKQRLQQIKSNQTFKDNKLNMLAKILGKGKHSAYIYLKIQGQKERQIIQVFNVEDLYNILIGQRKYGGAYELVFSADKQVILTQIELIKNLGYNDVQINRSRRGQGQDLKKCEHIITDDYEIPPSGQCLRNIIKSALGQERHEEIDKAFNDYIEKNKIYRDNIPECAFQKLSEKLGINIYKYNVKRNEVTRNKDTRKHIPNGQEIVTVLVDNHYIWLKKNFKKAYQEVQKKLKWTDKSLQDADIQDIQNKQLAYELLTREQCYDRLEQIYVADLEAFPDDQNIFRDYSSGLINLQKLKATFDVYEDMYEEQTLVDGEEQTKDKVYDEFVEDAVRECVHIKMLGEDQNKSSIKQMVDLIDSQQQPKTVKFFNKQTKKYETKKQKQQVKVFLHNAGKFDSYLTLQDEDLKFTNILKQDGCVVSLVIQATNCSIQFCDSMKYISRSLNDLCKSFKIPTQFSKQSINHDNITKDNFVEKRNQWEPYLENDVISLAMILLELDKKMYKVSQYVRPIRDECDKRKQLKKDDDKYLRDEQELGMFIFDYLTVSSYTYKLFQINDTEGTLRKSYKDPVMRDFIQSTIRGGRVNARRKEFKSKCVSYQDLDRAMQTSKGYYKQQHKEKAYDFINKKVPQCCLSEEQIQEIINNEDYYVPFDATSLYPSAMALLDSVYPVLESGVKFGSEMTDEQRQNIVRTYDCFFVEVDIYFPEWLKYVPIGVKRKDEKGVDNIYYETGFHEKIRINHVDYQEILKFEGQILKVHQGIYYEQTTVSPFIDLVKCLFDERNKVKNIDSILGDLFKLCLNSSYGKTQQKSYDYEQKIYSLSTAKRKNDTDVMQSEVLANGQIYMQKKIYKDQDFSCHHIGSLILSYSKQIMNNFVLKMNAHKEEIIAYQDTDSFYIPKKHLNKLGDIKDYLGGGKNDYGKNFAIIYMSTIGPKQKICYTISLKETFSDLGQKIPAGLIQKRVTYKGVQRQQQSELTYKTFQEITRIAQHNHNQKDKENLIEELLVDHHTWKKKINEGVQKVDKASENKVDNNRNKIIKQDCRKKLDCIKQFEKYVLETNEQDIQIYQFKHNPLPQ